MSAKLLLVILAVAEPSSYATGHGLALAVYHHDRANRTPILIRDRDESAGWVLHVHLAADHRFTHFSDLRHSLLFLLKTI